MARILIADDEATVRRTFGRLLKRDEYTCEFARDVDEAKEWISKESFDLVLTDINMPCSNGGSGLDLVDQLPLLSPDTAIVIISGVDRQDVATRAIEMGAYGYMIKPVMPNEVKIAVLNALRRRSLEQEHKNNEALLATAVRNRTLELRKARSETVERLMKAAEYRDDESGYHVERMSRYCAEIGHRLKWTKPLCERMRLASAMHDVGKVAIPERILRKPGKLDAEEIEEMRKHTVVGHKILTGSSSPMLEMAARIALTHHERYDGSGYPAGLATANIPLEGRIAAIADGFDGMTTRRIYKDPVSPKRAFEILQQLKGSWYDAKLVDLFLEGAVTIKQIMRDYPSDEK